jgi:hypothetical protein
MTGNEQVRFCGHCDLNVTDISKLTRAKAVKLVKKSNGRLCLRIHRNPLGEIITRPSVQKLYTISRRASRFAAGAFTAMLSLSAAAYAQSSGTGEQPSDPPVATQPIDGPDVENPPIENMPLGGDIMVVRHVQPLVLAASEGDIDAVNELLRSGMDINQAEDDGTTALEVAVANNDPAMVRRLLAAGASINTKHEDGRSILFSLDDDSSDEILQLLIRAGANVNQADDEGNTPLMNAAEWDSAELIQALLDAGAYVNAQNHTHNSALMVAAESGNAETVKTLLKAGAIYGLRNDDGADALHLAEENDCDEVIEILHQAGAVSYHLAEPETVVAPETVDEPEAAPEAVAEAAPAAKPQTTLAREPVVHLDPPKPALTPQPRRPEHDQNEPFPTREYRRKD